MSHSPAQLAEILEEYEAAIRADTCEQTRRELARLAHNLPAVVKELQEARKALALRDAAVEAACVEQCGIGTKYEPGNCILGKCGIARALADLGAAEGEDHTREFLAEDQA